MENYRIVKNENKNTLGILFGGDLLRWFDEEAALYAYNCLNSGVELVGVCVYSFRFIQPIYPGCRLKSTWKIAHVGKTSITVKGTYQSAHMNPMATWVKCAEGYSCLCTREFNYGKAVSPKIILKPEFDVEKLKADKDWQIVEQFKALMQT